MPKGLVRNGDFKDGNPITEPKTFGTPITEPHDFGNDEPQSNPTLDSNPVAWTPSPAHFGNIIGSSAPTQATPTFTPVGGSYGPTQNVVIASSGADAIYYTTDGSTPTTSSTLYIGAVTVATSETLRAIAVRAGYNTSAVGSASYAINGACGTPTFTPPAGTFSSAQSVTITSTNSTAIYYTTDGSTPTTSSTLYTGAITVPASETVKAIGVATGYSNSAVGSAAYVINLITYLYGPDTGTVEDLAPWNVQAWTDSDATFGNPAPSYTMGRSSGNPAEMNITAGVTAGCTIQFDIYLGTPGTPIPQFLFGCNSSGSGNMIIFDGRSSGAGCGIQPAYGWGTPTAYGYSGGIADITTGVWHTVVITIDGTGTHASWTLDGVPAENNVAITLSGPFIGLYTYTSNTWFDNISVIA